MVPTICAVGETRDNTTVDTSPSTPAPATRNKLTTPNLGSAQSGSSNFVRHLSTTGLSPDVTQIIRVSWKVSTQLVYNTPVRCLLDFCNNQQLEACVCYFLSNFYFSLNDSPSNHMKNVFYFSMVATNIQDKKSQFSLIFSLKFC